MNKADFMVVAVLGLIGFTVWSTGSGWPLLALALINYKTED